jgi:hypothetical protein
MEDAWLIKTISSRESRVFQAFFSPPQAPLKAVPYLLCSAFFFPSATKSAYQWSFFPSSPVRVEREESTMASHGFLISDDECDDRFKSASECCPSLSALVKISARFILS